MAGVKGQRSGGHNRKSRQAHILHGTFRQDRHGGAEDPVAPVGRPEPPRPLKGDALAEWKRLIGLVDARMLTREKYMVIYQLAKAFAEAERLEKQRAGIDARIVNLDKQVQNLDGAESLELMITANGIIAKLEATSKALTTEIRGHRNQIRQYLVEIGLTPASAGRVKLPASGGETPKSRVAQFLSGGKIG